jgi:predicted dehydrogenase
MHPTRREIIRSGIAAAGASVAASAASFAADAPAPAPAKPATTTQAATTRANSKPGMGWIGCGGIARYKAGFAQRYCDVVAVCDVDEGRAKAFAKDFSGNKASVAKDYRKVLDRKDVDVVMIDTPDHWHTKIAIDAMRAGKDVYCEKPLTLTIDEGRAICAVARETGRVFQVGTQQRSDERFQKLVALVHAGRIGRPRRVYALIGDTPQKGRDFKQAPPPKELDWEMWLGQAPRTPFIPERGHHTFRWWYEYSGGIMTDWGADHCDIAQLAVAPDLPGPTWIEPLEVEHPVPLVHGQPMVDNAFNTAIRFNVRVAFANGVEMFIRSHMKPFDHNAENGIRIEGDEGTLYADRFRVTGDAVEQMKDKPLPGDMTAGFIAAPPEDVHHKHIVNFFDCVKSRRTPNSDIFSHVRSLTTCHLANIAMRLGRKLRWDATAQEIVGDDEANSFQARPQRKAYEIG